MDLSKSYGITDPDLERDGVEVDLGEGAFVTVCRTNNPKFAAYLEKLRKPHERRIQRIQNGSADSDSAFRDLLDGLTRKAVAKFVLIGWRGVKDNGKTVKYSPEAAEKLMAKYEGFQEDVLTAANTQATFRKEVVEENEKNS